MKKPNELSMLIYKLNKNVKKNCHFFMQYELCCRSLIIYLRVNHKCYYPFLSFHPRNLQLQPENDYKKIMEKYIVEKSIVKLWLYNCIEAIQHRRCYKEKMRQFISFLIGKDKTNEKD